MGPLRGWRLGDPSADPHEVASEKLPGVGTETQLPSHRDQDRPSELSAKSQAPTRAESSTVASVSRGKGAAEWPALAPSAESARSGKGRYAHSLSQVCALESV